MVANGGEAGAAHEELSVPMTPCRNGRGPEARDRPRCQRAQAMTASEPTPGDGERSSGESIEYLNPSVDYDMAGPELVAWIAENVGADVEASLREVSAAATDPEKELTEERVREAWIEVQRAESLLRTLHDASGGRPDVLRALGVDPEEVERRERGGGGR